MKPFHAERHQLLWILHRQQAQQNLIEQGMEPVTDPSPEKTRRFVEEDIARWTPVIRAIGLKLN